MRRPIYSAMHKHMIIYILSIQININYSTIRERATGMIEEASHTSEYSEAYSGGFNDPLLPSDDDVSPSFCDLGYASG